MDKHYDYEFRSNLVSVRGDSKGHMTIFNGLRENGEATLHRRKKDSTGDKVMENKSEIDIDYNTQEVGQLDEHVPRISMRAKRDRETLFQNSY